MTALRGYGPADFISRPAARYDSAMIEDAIAAFAQIFTPPFRATLLKSLGLTIALLIVHLARPRSSRRRLHPCSRPSWLATMLSWIVGLGLVVGLAFLIAPVTSLVAGFFLDDMAAIVEREIDPDGAPGPADRRPAWRRFSPCASPALSILVNLIALALLFAPVVNIVAFLGANGYLLGREYFELAAMRFRPAGRSARDAASLCVAHFLRRPDHRRLRRDPDPQPLHAAFRDGLHDAAA